MKRTKFRENFKNPTKNHKFPVNAPSQLYYPFCSLLEPLKPVTVSNSSDNLTSQSTYSQWISKCVTTHYFLLFGRCCLSLAFHICQSSLLDLCELLIEDIQHAKVHWLRSEIFFFNLQGTDRIHEQGHPLSVWKIQPILVEFY